MFVDQSLALPGPIILETSFLLQEQQEIEPQSELKWMAPLKGKVPVQGLSTHKVKVAIKYMCKGNIYFFFSFDIKIFNNRFIETCSSATYWYYLDTLRYIYFLNPFSFSKRNIGSILSLTGLYRLEVWAGENKRERKKTNVF